MTMFRRRDAWWEMDGKAARGERRRQRFVESLAFTAAVAAAAGAATMWWMQRCSCWRLSPLRKSSHSWGGLERRAAARTR